jgi:hypothetical protein
MPCAWNSCQGSRSEGCGAFLKLAKKSFVLGFYPSLHCCLLWLSFYSCELQWAASSFLGTSEEKGGRQGGGYGREENFCGKKPNESFLCFFRRMMRLQTHPWSPVSHCGNVTIYGDTSWQMEWFWMLVGFCTKGPGPATVAERIKSVIDQWGGVSPYPHTQKLTNDQLIVQQFFRWIVYRR